MRCSPYVVRLNDSEKDHLQRVVAAAKSAQRDVLRAKIVLLAAADTPNARDAGSATSGWRACGTCPGQAGPAGSPPPRSPR
jgi:hypothetical protein